MNDISMPDREIWNHPTGLIATRTIAALRIRAQFALVHPSSNLRPPFPSSRVDAQANNPLGDGISTFEDQRLTFPAEVRYF
jgi:hypothetical protein